MESPLSQRRNAARLLVALALLDGAAALAQPITPPAASLAPASLRPIAGAAGAPGFRAGEGMVYRFSVGAIDAGRARLSVGLPVRARGRQLVAVQGDAHNAGWLSLLARLDDTYKVVIDVDSLAPREVHTVERGIRERTIDVALTPSPAGRDARMKLDFVKPGEVRHENRLIAGRPLDPVAALFTMRAAPLRTGDRFELLVFDGPALYRGAARVTGREALERPTGSVDTVRIDVDAVRVDDRGRRAREAPRTLTMWLSDDARRIPYRISGDTDFGRCDLELIAYREPPSPAPSTSASPATTQRAAR